MTPRPPRSPLFPYTPLFRSFGHVDLDDRVLRTKHLRGELLGELGLADAGRAHEHERADRAARVLEVGARAAQGAGDGDGRGILADDGRLQLDLEVEQALALLLFQAVERGARPLGDADRHLLPLA